MSYTILRRSALYPCRINMYGYLCPDVSIVGLLSLELHPSTLHHRPAQPKFPLMPRPEANPELRPSLTGRFATVPCALTPETMRSRPVSMTTPPIIISDSRLKVEYEVQLAHVLKQPVQGLDVDLYQVDQGERRLGRRRYHDEVEGRIVAVGDERGVRGARCGEQRRQGQKVAGAGRSVRHEGEDLGYQPLLNARFLDPAC
ncbi:Frataxin [Tolypocladium capitatum]|uniref:Frataxin n=1 Tax=Tolypocladium capitatum TaxID=45235 RepID=A0A2K3QR06_9HYPO|nr:Frataxin [Tolypocladium capitatum]